MSIKAFPVYSPDSGTQAGMDLRDYFAARTMQTLLDNTQVKDFDWRARMSYKMADETMKARG